MPSSILNVPPPTSTSAGASSTTTGPQATQLLSIGGIPVWELPNQPGQPRAIAFIADFDVDVDGSPGAYDPGDIEREMEGDKPRGIDNINNAIKTKIVDGEKQPIKDKDDNPVYNPNIVVVVGGKPAIQQSGPYKGYLISRTSLEDTTIKDVKDQTRYVNPHEIRYVALPPGLKDQGMNLGDIVLVINQSNQKGEYAIFADGGPPDKLGEGSIKLAADLGLKVNPQNARSGGTSKREILYIGFPGSGDGKPKTNSEIYQRGRNIVNQWGGVNSIKGQFPTSK